ncbi:MAG TPA: hypothetical protein VMC80_02720 [Patescibacteria group bacterium]|nr:hypothetical protein [Patescibacteria group bacterium]
MAGDLPTRQRLDLILKCLRNRTDEDKKIDRYALIFIRGQDRIEIETGIEGLTSQVGSITVSNNYWESTLKSEFEKAGYKILDFMKL